MSFIFKVLGYIPVLGFFIREAVEGHVSSTIFFALNIIMGWILAIYYFGYPAIIIPALCLVGTVFTALINITAQDLLRKS
ncbi:hypothetical protein [Sneathiella chinensis]|uniref:Lipid A biosynthesis N-terminal domain-containing protein n=1 Tax=Sneathiella chinensis TaxID=349750 RepID=A0ABQ5U382_9PROT|nr:hypothetical protein [Sneathiella chinensis]GLQ06293.1 hypothetical protein GCM10007924_15140 [Sneathiella chinensis]